MSLKSPLLQLPDTELSRRKKSRSLIPWQVRIAFWLLVAISGVILVVLPALTNIYLSKQEAVPHDWLATLEFIEVAQKWLLRAFMVCWTFFLGACFASFLNVVAWRLPRGRGIVGSSKCPYCDTPLAFWANMPVVGWLSSGGRCRTCRLPISPRYLFVEIILGLIFVLVFAVELVCGGVNLPVRPVNTFWGVERLVTPSCTDLLQIGAFHLILICLLFVMALVRLEKKLIPTSIFIFGLIAGIGFQCLWPWTQLTSWPEPQWFITIDQPEFWITLAIQLVVGFVCGWILQYSYRNRVDSGDSPLRECVYGSVLIGLFLGYPFVISVTLTLLLLDAYWAILGSHQDRAFRLLPIFKMGFTTLVLLLVWNGTSQFEFWPGPYSSLPALGIALVACLVLAILNSLIVIQPSGESAKSVSDDS